MSMAVDLTTPLTQAERSYLEGRGKYDEIQRADSMHGVVTPAYGTGDGTGLQQQPLLTSEAKAARLEQLKAELAALTGETETDDESDDDELSPYEDWKVPELDKELRRRDLPVTGDKPSKVAALYADDEAA